jgi:hypothetical protein
VDPLTALIISLAIARLVVRGAWDAGADQARAEVRRARAAVAADLRRRRSAGAARLLRRLEEGRARGPSSPVWWAWAGARAARAVRRGMRRERREAERSPRQIRATTGPFSRIFSAMWRGGRHAWSQAREQRAEQAAPARVPAGVCEVCGVVAAAAALAAALTRHGRTARMCGSCRAAAEAARRADAQAQAQRRGHDAGTRAGSPVDAEVVGDPPQPAPQGRPPLEPPRAAAANGWLPGEPQPPVTAPALPRRAPAQGEAPSPAAGAGLPPAGPAGAQAQAAPAARRLPAGGNVTCMPDGEIRTQRDWGDQSAAALGELEAVGVALDNMLGSLTAADAGRAQVLGVKAWADGVAAVMGHGARVIDEVNRRQDPFVGAVQAAGGPDEVAQTPYYAEM